MKATLMLILLVFTSSPAISAKSNDDAQVDIDGFSLQMYIRNNRENVKIHDKVKFTVNNADFIAVNYYEAYPEAKGMNFLNIALFKVQDGKNIKLVDNMIFDTGSPNAFGTPFLFKSKEIYLVFFPRCGGSGDFCEYHIYKISGQVNQIDIEDYYSSSKIKPLLNKDENIYCRGPKYTFKDEEIFCEVAVFKKSDPCCCPTRGTISFTYKFDGSAFKIGSTNRN